MLGLAPTNVWKIIFENATTLSLPADYFDDVNYANQRAIALTTQLSLPLICKASYKIAIQFLFSRIHLLSSPQLFQLLAYLQTRATSLEQNPGRWTQEIILGSNLGLRSAEVKESLLCLLKLLPSLVTIVDRTIPLVPTESPTITLSITSLKSLKTIILDSQIIDICSLCKVLDSCSSLIKLALGRIVPSDCEATLCSSSLRALHLRVNDLKENFFTVTVFRPRVRLYSLRHVTISNELPYDFPLAATECFFAAHGRQLSSFDWNNPCGNIDISFLFNLCPNVTRADYTVHIPPPKVTKRLHHLTHIGFHQTGLYLKKADSDDQLGISIVHLHRHIFALPQFPSMKCLSILDQTGVSILHVGGAGGDLLMLYRITLWWRRWVGSLAMIGIRVEDCGGHPLDPRRVIVPLWMIKSLVGIRPNRLHGQDEESEV